MELGAAEAKEGDNGGAWRGEGRSRGGDSSGLEGGDFDTVVMGETGDGVGV